MVAPALVIAALAAASTALFQVFKPRLPPYSIQIIKLPVPWYIDGAIMTQLTTNVRLHNDNFIPIDVHSLAMDMFYPTLGGELTHMGRIFDHKKPHSTQECLADKTCRKDKALDEPVWALQARSDFEATDAVFATVNMPGLFTAIASLGWNLIKSGGHLVMPTIGVMQVKASSSTPVTMSMICDNSVNVWTLVVVGVECTLNSLDIGWLEIDSTIDKLQEEVLFYLKPNSTGGVLESHKPRGKQTGIEKTLKKLNTGAISA